MKFIGIILVSLVLSNTAYAISPTTIDSMKEAQWYGQLHAKEQLDDFLRPWLSYEEKSEKLNENAEHAYLYTPFLLIATDSREKFLNGKNVTLAGSKEIVSDYAGTLSFSVVLFGDNPYFGKKTKVVIKQGGKTVRAYQVAIPPKAENISRDSTKSIFRLQCYFYFWEKKLVNNKPIVLSIITGDKKKHHFYFSAANIK